jgi:flavin-dependent dehydrogenase
LTLAQCGLDVALVAQPPVAGDRPGESLSAPALDLLRELGVEQQFAAIPHRDANTTYSAWGTNLLARRDAIAQPAGAGFVLDRAAFERMLLDAVTASGIRMLAHRPVADFSIDCSGRAAVVARGFTDRSSDDQLLAAYAFLEHAEPDVEPTPATLIEAVPNGWWYASLLPDGRLAIALFADPDTMPRGITHDTAAWQTALDETHFVREWIASAGFAAGAAVRLASAGTSRLARFHGATWVAAGDAAVTFDPLSSQGMTTALWSGRQAALATLAHLAGDEVPMERYAAAIGTALERYVEQRTIVYRHEARFAGHPFWQRRHAGLPEFR